MKGRQLLVLAAIGFLPCTFAYSDSETIAGEVLLSFEDPHYLVQTDKYIIRLRDSALGESERQQLKRLNSFIVLEVPQAAVDLIWRVTPEPAIDNSGIQNYSIAPRNEFVGDPQVKAAAGRVALKGKLLASADNKHLIIQSGSYLFRIKADEAGNLQPGKEWVDVKMPASAVEFTWNTKQPSKGGRTLPQADVVKTMDGYLQVKGKLLTSFSKPHYLVQAKGHVFQLSAEGFSATQIKKLKNAGSHVSLIVPSEAVMAAWPVNTIEKTARVPATTAP